jgi:hypothetical protein
VFTRPRPSIYLASRFLKAIRKIPYRGRYISVAAGRALGFGQREVAFRLESKSLVLFRNSESQLRWLESLSEGVVQSGRESKANAYFD